MNRYYWVLSLCLMTAPGWGCDLFDADAQGDDTDGMGSGRSGTDSDSDLHTGTLVVFKEHDMCVPTRSSAEMFTGLEAEAEELHEQNLEAYREATEDFAPLTPVETVLQSSTVENLEQELGIVFDSITDLDIESWDDDTVVHGPYTAVKDETTLQIVVITNENLYRFPDGTTRPGPAFRYDTSTEHRTITLEGEELFEHCEQDWVHCDSFPTIGYFVYDVTSIEPALLQLSQDEVIIEEQILRLKLKLFSEGSLVDSESLTLGPIGMCLESDEIQIGIL